MPENLERKARDFARELASLLNTTVTDGITLSTVQVQRGDSTRYAIGHGLSRTNPHRPTLIPLTTSRREARLYLYAFHVMTLDDKDGDSLADWKANYAVQLGKSADTGTLFAYDYTRDAQNQYPRAHFHIYAELGANYQKALEGSGRDKLRDLHFPLGGFPEPDGSVRFRPILEDIIEMLILEKMVGLSDAPISSGEFEGLFSGVFVAPHSASCSVGEVTSDRPVRRGAGGGVGPLPVCCFCGLGVYFDGVSLLSRSAGSPPPPPRSDALGSGGPGAAFGVFCWLGCCWSRWWVSAGWGLSSLVRCWCPTSARPAPRTWETYA